MNGGLKFFAILVILIAIVIVGFNGDLHHCCLITFVMGYIIVNMRMNIVNKG